jgi:feruloyl esterase
MKSFVLIMGTLIAVVLVHSPPQAQPACGVELLLQLPDVTITSITRETQYAPHCKIAGVIGPEIHFELHLPDDWNGKFVMSGGGGFSGSVQNVLFPFGVLESGYATVGHDTGHQGHPLDASWALNNMERIVNFGHQSVHRTAVTAKALIEAHYQKEIIRSYFVGCSRGGGQALMEAQRYPDDFDGIVAGAPANNWTKGLGAGTIQIMQAMFPDPDNIQEAVLGPEELELLESAILEHCDELDGIKDGILNDPRQCDFEIASLLCKGEKTESCLTEEQVRAARAIYEGPKDKDGDLFYGFPFGGETDAGGWPRWLAGGLKFQEDIDEFQSGIEIGDYPEPVTPNAHYAFGNGIMRYFIYHDPDWSYADYDFETFREDAKLAGETLNATDPDLSEFRERGGKLLMYTGWSDAAITALGTIGYYESVLADEKAAAEDVRLFMMPGVLHCIGGDGPSWVNWVDEIDKWVETGMAPDQITAYFVDEKYQLSGSRLLCTYPHLTNYDGKGDPRDVSSFSCGN